MKLFFSLIPAFFLFACSSTSDTAKNPQRALNNPIQVEYNSQGKFSDYQFFRQSLPQLAGQSFEHSRRWALLKEGPSALSFSGADLLYSPVPGSTLAPDPSALDWTPWWMDLLKIEVSALVISKEASSEAFASRACLNTYLARLEKISAEKEQVNVETANGKLYLDRLRPERIPSPEELWKNAVNVKIKKEQLYAWLARMSYAANQSTQVREYALPTLGLRRRLLLIKQGDKISAALELARDPYQSQSYFSKAGQNNLCERWNLGLALSVGMRSLRCADFEGAYFVELDEKLWEQVLHEIKDPPDSQLGSLYTQRCEELADFHAAQWVPQDRKRLVEWLKKYPQIAKRLRYFATMESQALLAAAAQSRQQK